MRVRAHPPIKLLKYTPDYGGPDYQAIIEEGPFEVCGYGDTASEAVADAEAGWIEHCEEEQRLKVLR